MEKATPEVVTRIKGLRSDGKMIREIMEATKLSKATVYRALAVKGQGTRR